MHKTLYAVVIFLGIVILVLASVLIFKVKTEKPAVSGTDELQPSAPAQPIPSNLPVDSNQPAVSPNKLTPPVATSAPKNNMHTITLKTTLGDIVFETYDADAPKASANFVNLAEKGFYDNVIFHRVIPGFMIQGGDPTGTGRGGPGYSFEDELNPATESYKAGYKRGVVAMANAGPNTNGSQFFVMHADYPLPNQYTIFGRVVSGIETVDKIASLPTGPNDRPVDPPKILSVSVATK